MRGEAERLPHFITEIDGLDIHFIHVRSQHEDALPLVVNHGWPGSIIEQLKIIDRLTDPTAHGASAATRSMSSSRRCRATGSRGSRRAPAGAPSAWAERGHLMKRLGYTRYVAQGGDWGAFVVDQMGLQAPDGLLAITPTCLRPFRGHQQGSRSRRAAAPVCRPRNSALRAACQNIQAGRVRTDDGGAPADPVRHADSPSAGRLAPRPQRCDGQPAAAVVSALDRTTSSTGELTRDEILDNITLYWLTNTGVRFSPLLGVQGRLLQRQGRLHPRAVTVFPASSIRRRAAGRKGLSKPHLLQRGRQGRPFRRVGAAGDLLGRTRAAFRSLGPAQ